MTDKSKSRRDAAASAPSDVHEHAQDLIGDHYLKVHKYRLQHEQYAGGLGPVVEREVVRRGAVTVVLPIDIETRQVLLVEQFRIGPYAAGCQPWLIECIAGVNEAGESALDVARREAQEEAGIEIGALVEIAGVFSSPGAFDEFAHLFVATCDLSRAGGVHGLDEEGEDIRVRVLAIDDALALLEAGVVRNAKAVIMLQWLALNAGRIEQVFE